MSGFEAIAAIATVASLGISVAGSIFGGQKEKEADYATAHTLEGMGRDEFAASQREAEEKKLQGKLIESRIQAVAAASGGGAGADSPTIMKLLTETGERNRYAVQSTLYAGARQRQNYMESAAAKRRSGDASLLGSFFTGFGTLAGGIGSLDFG
jgi:hypothetical protein